MPLTLTVPDLMPGAAAMLFADGDPEMADLMPEIMGNLFATPGAAALMEAAFATADLSLEAVALGNGVRHALTQEMARAFGQADLLLIPTSPVPAFGCSGPLPTVVAGREVGPQACALFTGPFNMSGHPVVSVPMGMVEGAPVGMQIVARRHEDALALAAGGRLRAGPALAAAGARPRRGPPRVMDLTTIRAEVADDGVATLTLARPEAGNSIDLALARDLNEVTTGLVRRPAGAGRAAAWARARTSAWAATSRASPAATTCPPTSPTSPPTCTPPSAALARLDAPVVAAVQGSAAGAGMSLAALADIVLAGASSRFVMAYTAIGLTPDGSAPGPCPGSVGLRRALELALTNRMLSAEEAVAEGLATRVVADDALADEALALARTLAAGPTGALGAAKRLLRESLRHDLETQMALETAVDRHRPPGRPTPARASPRSWPSGRRSFTGEDRW